VRNSSPHPPPLCWVVSFSSLSVLGLREGKQRRERGHSLLIGALGIAAPIGFQNYHEPASNNTQPCVFVCVIACASSVVAFPPDAYLTVPSPVFVTVLSCCLVGMRSLVAAQSESTTTDPSTSSSSSNGGGGATLFRSGIIGNYMDRDDYEFCLEAMRASDGDGDDEISEEEFVDFCRYMAPPFALDGFDAFDELPVAFRDVFFGVACLCDPSGAAGSSCCAGTVAHVRVPDVSSIDALTSEDRLYLYAACSNTRSVAERYADHANQTTPQSTPLWPVGPTPPPPSPPSNSRPSPPQPPSTAPTTRPTRRPTNDNVDAPTDRPTRRPSNAEERPSDSPTEDPGVEIAPTAIPTAASEGPTATDRPTAAAANETTSSPSSSLFPTESPARQPSSEPSPSPTPLEDVVAEATAKVEYFFSAPTSAMGNGTTAAILSDLQVAMNRLAPQVTIHSDRDVRWGPHFRRRRRRQRRRVRNNNRRRLQALQVRLPTSFGMMETVGTWVES
jgi:hypothetical protein